MSPSRGPVRVVLGLQRVCRPTIASPSGSHLASPSLRPAPASRRARPACVDVAERESGFPPRSPGTSPSTRPSASRRQHVREVLETGQLLHGRDHVLRLERAEPELFDRIGLGDGRFGLGDGRFGPGGRPAIRSVTPSAWGCASAKKSVPAVGEGVGEPVGDAGDAEGLRAGDAERRRARGALLQLGDRFLVAGCVIFFCYGCTLGKGPYP